MCASHALAKLRQAVMPTGEAWKQRRCHHTPLDTRPHRLCVTLLLLLLVLLLPHPVPLSPPPPPHPVPLAQPTC
eukprot:60169-Chlamydomonas_euryale.AAC.1